MGRENMADYNADSLTMLETWDAAVQHLESTRAANPQAIVIAETKTTLKPIEVIFITEEISGSEYRGRDLPIYKVLTETDDNTSIYINPMSGDISAIRSDSWRMWDLLWALHIMDYDERDNINNFLLRLFSILALISSISGITLFFVKKR